MGQSRRPTRSNIKTPRAFRAQIHRRDSFRAKIIIQPLLTIVVTALVIGMAWLSIRSTARQKMGNRVVTPVVNLSETPLLTAFEIEPQTLTELLSLPANDLAKVDIARKNLLCATGLPGAAHLDSRGIHGTLATLDKWATRVRDETDRYFYRFLRNPSAYKNSEAYFRMLMLVTVLQQDLGVHYNQARVRDVDFTESQDLFIHGMVPAIGHMTDSGIVSGGGGTCVSMPVLYTAIARRLGYPVKLVTTAAHVFCRWDGADHPNPHFRGRFNCEATNQGLDTPSDDYYRTWPRIVTEAEIGANRYLESLPPDQELALFFAIRGHNLLDTGRISEARQAYSYAIQYGRDVRLYRGFFTQTNQVLAHGRGIHSGETAYARIGSGFASTIYNMDPMSEIKAIREMNARNTRHMTLRSSSPDSNGQSHYQ